LLFWVPNGQLAEDLGTFVFAILHCQSVGFVHFVFVSTVSQRAGAFEPAAPQKCTARARQPCPDISSCGNGSGSPDFSIRSQESQFGQCQVMVV